MAKFNENLSVYIHKQMPSTLKAALAILEGLPTKDVDKREMFVRQWTMQFIESTLDTLSAKNHEAANIVSSWLTANDGNFASVKALFVPEQLSSHPTALEGVIDMIVNLSRDQLPWKQKKDMVFAFYNAKDTPFTKSDYNVNTKEGMARVNKALKIELGQSWKRQLSQSGQGIKSKGRRQKRSSP